MTESFTRAQRLAVELLNDTIRRLNVILESIWDADAGRETFRKTLEDNALDAYAVARLDSRLAELLDAWPVNATRPAQAFVVGPGWRLQPLGKACEHEGLQGFCEVCRPGMREMIEEVQLRR